MTRISYSPPTIPSNPPSGKKKVTNIYYDDTTGDYVFVTET